MWWSVDLAHVLSRRRGPRVAEVIVRGPEVPACAGAGWFDRLHSLDNRKTRFSEHIERASGPSRPKSRRFPAQPGLPVVGHLHHIARSGPVGHLADVDRPFPDGIVEPKSGSRIGILLPGGPDVAVAVGMTRVFVEPSPAIIPHVRLSRRGSGQVGSASMCSVSASNALNLQSVRWHGIVINRR